MALSAHRLALTFFAGVLLVWLVVMAVVMRHAALPAEATGPMLAIFEPGTPEDQIFASLTRAAEDAGRAVIDPCAPVAGLLLR